MRIKSSMIAGILFTVAMTIGAGSALAASKSFSLNNKKDVKELKKQWKQYVRANRSSAGYYFGEVDGKNIYFKVSFEKGDLAATITPMLPIDGGAAPRTAKEAKTMLTADATCLKTEKATDITFHYRLLKAKGYTVRIPYGKRTEKSCRPKGVGTYFDFRIGLKGQSKKVIRVSNVDKPSETYCTTSNAGGGETDHNCHTTHYLNHWTLKRFK